MLYIYIIQPWALQKADMGVFDFFLSRTAGQSQLSNGIVIVDIDEASLDEYGQWPWPRYYLARMVKNLTEAGADSIGLDIILSESDRTSPNKIKLDLMMEDVDIQISGLPDELKDYDIYLGNILKESPSVLGFYLRNDGDSTNNVPRQVSYVKKASTDIEISFEELSKQDDNIIRATNGNFPVEPLFNSRSRSGFTNSIPDADGVIRSVPLLMDYKGKLYASLALSSVMQAKEIKTLILEYDLGGLSAIKAGGYTIPVNNDATITVPYKGPAKSYRYVSAIDILESRTEGIKNKIVFIGSSATGLLDVKSVPLDKIYPGVEVHATIVDAIINGQYIIRPSVTPAIQAFGIVILGTLCAMLFGLSRPSVYLPVALLTMIMVSFASYYIFLGGYFISPVSVMATIGAQAFFIVGIRFWREEQNKKLIQSAFGKYVTPEVVASIAKKEDDYLKGQKRNLSILFCDLNNFTTLSEKMEPQDVMMLLNEFFTPMTAIVRSQYGTIDKYMGDAMLSFWNAPKDVPDHANRCITAAMLMQEEMVDISRELQSRYNTAISMGIGIHTDDVFVGNMGSVDMLNYTIIGDGVNVASRLEGLQKLYGLPLIVSEDTVKLCGDRSQYKFVFIDTVVVKGRKDSMNIYTVMTADDYDHSSETRCKFESAFEKYRNGDFADALNQFAELAKDNSKMHNLYRERCEFLLKNPPEKWEGVWTFDTK